MPFMQFGEWLPDIANLNNPGTIEALNVIPDDDAYLPFNMQSEYTNALDARPQGVFSGKDADDIIYNYAGDETKLYILGDTTWNDASSTTYSTPELGHWSFLQWNNRIIATNFANNVQSVTMGATTFADLSGGPPKAKHVASVKDFAVLCNVDDTSDGKVPNRVAWSAIGNIESWTLNSTTQSSYFDLKGSGGVINGIVGGEVGYIFQERSIWRMTYVGSPVVFQFDEVERDKGAVSPKSIVRAGRLIFYLGVDGFYVFDGQRSVNIGQGRVNTFFFSDFSYKDLDRVWGTLIPEKNVIAWCYPGDGAVDSQANRILFYNYGVNSKMRWSHAELSDPIYLLGKTLQQGYTLEGLDSVSSSIDDLPASLDARLWVGGSPAFSAFDTTNKMTFFEGTERQAIIETAEVQISPTHRTQVTSVRPLVNKNSEQSPTIEVQVKERDVQSNVQTTKSFQEINASGEAPVRSNSRYHSFRVRITNGFEKAFGVEITKFKSGGFR